MKQANKQTSKLIGTLMALGALAIPAQAAVTFVSSLQNDSSSEISSWSATGTAKSADLDGNNYYGSDGYSWMNASGSGGVTTALTSLVESAPSYTSGITYTGSGTGSTSYSGSHGPLTDNRLIPAGTGIDDVSVGYAGINYAGTATGATVLQEIFSYTMNRNMAVGETIRLGVVLDSFGDGSNIVGADSLRIVAGGTADATGVTRSGVMDMYFFDITGLSSGDEIQIWGANATETTGALNSITISGVTFDSVAVPEPSTTALLGLGGLALIMRRRK